MGEVGWGEGAREERGAMGGKRVSELCTFYLFLPPLSFLLS